MEFFSGKLTKHFPTSEACFVSTLELDNVLMSFFLEIFISVESLLGILIKSLQICNIRSVLQKVWEVFVQFLNEHAELGSPVTHMVDSLDVVAQELEDSADTITLNS